MSDSKVTMLVTLPEKGGVVTHRNKSANLKFEADATQFAQAVRLSAFPDFAVIEATFTVKEIAGRTVSSRQRRIDNAT